MRKSTIGDRVALGGLPLVASLLAVIPNMGPIELGFGVRSMFDMELESNMLLPVCVAFEPLLLDDGALESKRLTGGDLNVCLLGNILVDVEALPGFNSVLGIPDILSFDGGGVDVLSIEGGELKLNEASPETLFRFETTNSMTQRSNYCSAGRYFFWKSQREERSGLQALFSHHQFQYRGFPSRSCLQSHSSGLQMSRP